MPGQCDGPSVILPLRRQSPRLRRAGWLARQDVCESSVFSWKIPPQWTRWKGMEKGPLYQHQAFTPAQVPPPHTCLSTHIYVWKVKQDKSCADQGLFLSHRELSRVVLTDLPACHLSLGLYGRRLRSSLRSGLCLIFSRLDLLSKSVTVWGHLTNQLSISFAQDELPPSYPF